MTSNVGVSSLNEKGPIGFDTSDNENKSADRTREIIEREVKDAFAPEFLNRLDEVIMFNPLSEEDIVEITALMLEKTRDRLNNIDIDIEYDRDVVKLLAKEGFNDEYGARPLERHITKMIENTLAEDILDGKLNRDSTIKLSVADDELKFENIEQKQEKNEEVVTEA